MTGLSRLHSATLTRVAEIITPGLTTARIRDIIRDLGKEPLGASKPDIVAHLLRDAQADQPQFVTALTALAHPNNFGALGDLKLRELIEAFRRDGLVLKWTAGGYEISDIKAVVSAAVGVPSGTDNSVKTSSGSATKQSDPNKETMNNTNPEKKRKVFVVYGRDHKLNTEFFSFLRAAGLQPLEWQQIVASLGKPSPYTLEVVKHGMEIAQAFVVFGTPDEKAELRSDLATEHESDRTREQPRPNVLIELGMALGIDKDRTVVVLYKNAKLGSDLDGVNHVAFDGEVQSRNSLVGRLRVAGCSVDTDGSHWLYAGTFR